MRVVPALLAVGLVVGCVGCQPASTQKPSTTRSATPIALGSSPTAMSTSGPATSPPLDGQAQVFAVLVKDFYIGATGYQIQLVAANGGIAQITNARNRSFSKSGLVDLPVTSTTSTRVYYLEGDSDIWYLTPSGKIDVAYRIAMTGDQLATFSVSPDDRRIAVTVIDYSGQPPTMHLFTDDLAGGHKVEIFSSSSVYEWPVGWHQGHLVLAVSRLPFVQNAGDWFMGSQGFHIVDAASGNRLSTICEDTGADTPFPTSPWGGTCQIYPKVANVVSWEGVKRELLVGQCRVVGPPSPDGSEFAVRGVNAGCTTSATEPIRLIDSGGRVKTSVAVGNPLGWLDNSHLISQEDLPAFSAPNAVAQIKILDVADSSVVVVNASGFFAGDLPGGLG